ncbi:FG-GAP and VCBS repeat-containing protein [Micromonospora sp. NPDC007230]|uniref:FG-GAP and VCBS repeat-containing protein n=1 Tax=Micromonospora sp. NPDC007230 TaxID=3364237 RepID=UPI00369B97A5
MKIARGIRGTAVAVVSLLSISFTSASAASRQEPPPGPTQAAAAGSDVLIEDGGRDRIAAQAPGNAAANPTPRKVTARQSTAAATQTTEAPQTTAARSAVRAKPRFDMDGDGKDELVVGGFASPGGMALHVLYSGLSRQDILTAPATSEPRHRFSFPFTAGDFNGDGVQDLAVASQRMLSQGVFEHGIFVYYGGSSGLDRANVKYLAGPHALAFAAGDLNNDGRDELAVSDGGATEDRDGPFRGSVTVLSGTENGLTKDGSVTVRQVVPRWSGLVKEHFGTALAMGDFTGDGYDDLVVSGSRLGATEFDWHGMVTLFPGSVNGPSTAKVTKIEGAIDTYESLPVDLMVMSDMDQDGRDDLILGMPRYAGGKVVYLRGVNSGLGWAGHRVLDQNTPGVPGEPDLDNGSANGHFGSALATGDATGDGIPDLLVGAMGMNVGTVADAGSVTLIPGTPEGPTGASSVAYTQRASASIRKPKPPAEFEDSTPAVGDRPEPNDYLGSSVAILDLDGTGPLEMFVESKYEDLFQQPPGEPSGLITTLQLLQRQKLPNSSSPPPGSRLVAVKQQRPADFSDTEFRIVRLTYGLLSG